MLVVELWVVLVVGGPARLGGLAGTCLAVARIL